VRWLSAKWVEGACDHIVTKRFSEEPEIIPYRITLTKVLYQCS